MITNYFNELRDAGVEISQEDTLWIDIFTHYVISKDKMTQRSLDCAFKKIIKIIKPNQTSKDVIAYLRKFQIDFTPIDEEYELSLTNYKAIFGDFEETKGN